MECQLINVEGIMELENNHSTSTIIIISGRNKPIGAKTGGQMFDEKWNISVVPGYLPTIYLELKRENSNFIETWQISP